MSPTLCTSSFLIHHRFNSAGKILVDINILTIVEFNWCRPWLNGASLYFQVRATAF